jgi:hypothetical protein
MNRCDAQLFRLERSNEVGTISPATAACATRKRTPRSGRSDPLPTARKSRYPGTQRPAMRRPDGTFWRLGRCEIKSADMPISAREFAIVPESQCTVQRNATLAPNHVRTRAIRVNCAEVGEGVRAYVAGIAVMAFHPSLRDPVPSRGVVESAPQVAVLDRLLVRCRPAPFLTRLIDALTDALTTAVAMRDVRPAMRWSNTSKPGSSTSDEQRRCMNSRGPSRTHLGGPARTARSYRYCGLGTFP